MHESPSSFRNKGDLSPSSSSSTSSSTNTWLSLVSFVALAMSAMACFATTWATRMLSEWPEGSVMEIRRTALFSEGNTFTGNDAKKRVSTSSSSSVVVNSDSASAASSSKRYSAAAFASRLHAALPRCADDIFESILSGGSVEQEAPGSSANNNNSNKKGSFRSVTESTQKQLREIDSMLKAIETMQVQEAEEKRTKMKNINKSEQQHSDDNRRNRNNDENSSPALWAPPQHAIRAATALRNVNLLPGFYAKHNNHMKELAAANGAAPLTSVSALSNDFQRVMGFSRAMMDESRENVTYAVNTVDKLLYQLNNFEPLRHRGLEFKSASSSSVKSRIKNKNNNNQWNPVVGLLDDDKINEMIAKQQSSASASSPGSCPVTKRKSLIIGMSSVSRSTNYLHATIDSLINSIKSSGWLDRITILLLDADVPAGKNIDIKIIRTGFAKYLKSGVLRILARGDKAHMPHPEMRQGAQALTQRWGDQPARILWRSKQVLDVSWLMDYAASRSVALSLMQQDLTKLLHELHRNEHHDQSDDLSKYESLPTDREILFPADDQLDQVDERQNAPLLSALRDAARCPPLGGYFLMLEDDIIATHNFVPKLLDWLKESMMSRDTSWTVVSTYNPWPVRDGEKLPPFKFFGVIGQLFRLHDMPTIVEFLRKNFDQSPLDWLFVDILKKVSGQMVCHSPSLFQHEGLISSMEGKTQDGRAVDFVG